MNARLFNRALCASLAGLVALGGGGVLLHGCGDATTGRERVHFNVRVGGFEHAAGAVTFSNDQGWTITLTEARVAVGPLYLNTIEPTQCDTCGAMSLFHRVETTLLPRAWAHGQDHLGTGEFVGQVTRQVEVDALSPQLVEIAGGGDGIDATVRTAEAWLYNRDGSLRGAAIRVAGVAQREEPTAMEVPFEGALVADESIVTARAPLDQARRVRGIPAALTLTEGGALVVRVDVREWFKGADFSELADRPTNSAGRHAFTPADNVGRAFINNARAARGVFSVTFQPSPQATRN